VPNADLRRILSVRAFEVARALEQEHLRNNGSMETIEDLVKYTGEEYATAKNMGTTAFVHAICGIRSMGYDMVGSEAQMPRHASDLELSREFYIPNKYQYAFLFEAHEDTEDIVANQEIHPVSSGQTVIDSTSRMSAGNREYGPTTVSSYMCGQWMSRRSIRMHRYEHIGNLLLLDCDPNSNEILILSPDTETLQTFVDMCRTLIGAAPDRWTLVTNAAMLVSDL
jgi:hypothetical protein